MLVMRRRAGERLLIGDQIEIEILEVAGTRVKLGIDAPDTILITRKEAKATRDQNIAAARGLQADAILSVLRSLSLVNSQARQHPDRPSH
jgi:carbon storage regulator